MSRRDPDTMLGGGDGKFPSTWSSVFEIEDRSCPKFKQRLESLLARYWKPIYRTIRIVWGRSNEDAKDMTQAFLMMAMEDDLVSRFCPQKGRFRSFLKAALNHFMADQEKARQRIKRGGGKVIVSMAGSEDEAEIDPSDRGRRPEEILDREWADALLEDCIMELRNTLTADGRKVLFDVYMAIDMCSAPEGASYREVAERLGLTEMQVTRYLHVARRMLRSLLLARIGEYALSESEIYEELRQIYAQ